MAFVEALDVVVREICDDCLVGVLAKALAEVDRRAGVLAALEDAIASTGDEV